MTMGGLAAALWSVPVFKTKNHQLKIACIFFVDFRKHASIISETQLSVQKNEKDDKGYKDKCYPKN
jgi:hypothetical protein